ncbi:MAG: division/cell wall cluster transcriptional repressor MraZ [Oscillospiraceae bacterium]|nr:division/cell wall cluster transcriptional repressor MraZ [Oscillospiraceae bacterium]
MNSLTGEYRHGVDAKGRFFMPSRLLKALGEPFYIFKGSSQYLCVYNQEQWDKLRENLSELPKSQSRDLRRNLYSTAQDCVADSQGRVMLSPALREHAKIDKNIAIIGAGDYAEIWNDAAWEEECRKFGETPMETAMDLLGL